MNEILSATLFEEAPTIGAQAACRTMDIVLADALLGKCNVQSLARLLPQIERRHLQEKEVIYTAGQPATHFFVIVTGQIQLSAKNGASTVQTTGRLGEEAATDAACYLRDACSTLPTEIICIPRAAMLSLIDTNSGLKTDFLFSLSNQLSGDNLMRYTAPAPTTASKQGKNKISEILGWLLTLLFPLLILEFGEQSGLASKAVIFSAIFSATVTMWVFSLVDDYIPGLFALLATLVTGLVPAPVILSGFASDGFLMALSTLGLGTVVVTSGLGYRFMLALLLRLPNTQFWHNFGLFITGTILTPIIPTANGRMALVAPFYSDMVESLTLKLRGAATTRLATSCFGGVSLFSAIFITSKSVNFAVYGLLSPQGQDKFQWMTWLLTALVAGLVLLAINGIAAFIWFRNHEAPHLPKERVTQQLQLLGEIKTREWTAIAGVAFMIIGIVTSSIHRVQPPWLGFTMLFGLLLCGSLDKKELKEKVDWTFLLYMSGITGIVAAFNYLGLDRELGAALPGLGDYMRTNFGLFVLMLFGVVNLIRLVVPINATVVILATILMPLAEVNGVNAWLVGFIILLFSEAWFLPYQCSYYLQLQELNQERALYHEKSFLQFNAFLNFARLAAVYASVPYWKMLGIL